LPIISQLRLPIIVTSISTSEMWTQQFVLLRTSTDLRRKCQRSSYLLW